MPPPSPNSCTRRPTAAEHHDPYEKSAPPHDWWDWYAAYLNARQNGSTQEEASISAARHMKEERHVLP